MSEANGPDYKGHWLRQFALKGEGTGGLLDRCPFHGGEFFNAPLATVAAKTRGFFSTKEDARFVVDALIIHMNRLKFFRQSSAIWPPTLLPRALAGATTRIEGFNDIKWQDDAHNPDRESIGTVFFSGDHQREKFTKTMLRGLYQW
ncbi:hypothetical protein CO251_05845 [Sulfobacillus sp. hq2]|nr:hypothetical protein CO251_05845 [Sulfobacillus sp. hq2]